MRPIKELINEEYWNIGFRKYSEDNSVVNAKEKYKFEMLKADMRYWYADPFLFEKDGRTYLFVEMFDNKTEVGIIGCSEFINGSFTKPVPVLKESFHLSYPLVFEKDGNIIMMPETHEDKCIQFYRAVDFPYKWEKMSVAVKNTNAVDTVIENGMYIAGIICPQNDMSVDLALYNSEGKETEFSPVYKSALDKRGAGNTFSYKNIRLRPAQCCENGTYGGKIIFYKINQCDNNGYDEEVYSVLSPQNIITEFPQTPEGIHTYAKTDKIEIVDIKYKRFNLKRLVWIFSKKIKG